MTLDDFRKILESYNFQRYGFTSVSFDVQKDSLIALFSNAHLKMKITCSKSSMIISFIKSEYEYFFLREYLLAKKLYSVDQMDHFAFAPHYKTPEEFLLAHLDLLDKTIQSYLMDIIQGVRWEDIPRDWSIADR